MPHLHSGAACDRPVTIKTAKLPPIPKGVWQQPPDSSITQHNFNNINKDSSKKFTRKTQMMTVASQTSPPKAIQPQNHEIAMEQPPGNETGNHAVPLLSCSKICPTDIQEQEKYTMTTSTGDNTIAHLTTATSLIQAKLVRDEQTKELYLPITSTVVLKRKQERLQLPLIFKNNITVDSGAYISAIAQKEVHTIKQNARNTFLKIDNPPKFESSLWPVRKTLNNNHT